MRKIFVAALTALISLSALAGMPAPLTWTTPSANSSESMPVGGGDVGLNLWVENGDLMFYISRSGTYDENNTLLKLGRVRVAIPGDSLAPFSQTLNLAEGYARVRLHGATIDLWADVNKPVVHVEITSPKAVSPVVSYETWRYADRPFRKGEGRQSSWKWSGQKGLKTTADKVEADGNSVTFWHQNPLETVFDITVEKEGLNTVKGQISNPLKNLTFGGRLQGKDLRLTGESEGEYLGTDFRAWNFTTKKPTKKLSFEIVLNTLQAETHSEWLAGLDATASKINLKKDRAASRNWWNGFWNRSYIESDGEASGMARNYTLFRYMLGCNAYGNEPTKFNGGLFTFDPVGVDTLTAFTPDYRNWGGGTMTAQNQRLVYWPMLKSGDIDMMRPQFDFYNRMLPTAELRVKEYWGHDGALFSEQTEQFGLPNFMEYGSKRREGFDPGVDYNAWLEYSWDTVLEFCQMMLDAHRYNGLDIAEYQPLIEQSLRFFDEHYRMLASRRSRKDLDGDGRLVIYPGSACETYKMAYNPSSTVAGLRRVTGDYIEYLKATGDTATSAWTALYKRLPDVPLHNLDGGYKAIAPAKSWERVNNIETPQLYPVWPWRFYDVATADSANLAIGRNTYFHDPDALKFRSTKGWKQDNIWAAALGLPDEAYALTSEKLSNGKHRFPAFFGPGFDWTPDHNWGGSGMIGLQEMLLQTDGDRILLFPAWPLEKDIRFKLHAPGSTTVEAEL